MSYKMAAEFHHKTVALFGEFKKREIRFLNPVVNLKSNVNWKNQSSPLQEYMQKINRREQETEKTYKDLMREMEDLGKQTDQMTLKLEKLNALRNVSVSSHNSAWPSSDVTYDRLFQSYNSTLAQATPKILSSVTTNQDFFPRLQPNFSLTSASFQMQSPNPSCNSVTTQTEYVFCNNCHFPLILNSETPVPNKTFPLISNERTIEENLQKPPVKPPRTQENVNFSKGDYTTKSDAKNLNSTAKSNNSFSHSHVTDCGDSMLMNEGVSSGGAEINLKELELVNKPVERRMSKNSVENAQKDEFTNETFQKRISESETESRAPDGVTHELAQKRMSESYIDDVVIDEQTYVPVQKRMSENYIDNVVTGDSVTHTEERRYVKMQDSDLLSNDGNFEQTISRSDDESMTHEFNFLDSDKTKILKGQAINQMSVGTSSQLTENLSANKRHENTNSETGPAIQSNPKELLKVQQTLGKESSYIVGPPSPSAHSENTSMVSESDSSSEKETPLTATAAYQALLGNVSAAKTKQKSVPISDSDSEDEIESALANAVRRTSHIAFDAPFSDPKADKRKESMADINAERNTKPVDSISTNKPQNKLSKNTRKVLGLDTSSGSEVDLEVKSSTNKIEEESDEFDFYD